jgi:hypothetical protein
MPSLRLDDAWFYAHRQRLLAPLSRARRPAPERAVMAVLGGAARAHPSDDTEASERALSRLAPRHAAAARAHAQFYRAALEATGVLDADPIVQAALQVEWFWYTSPFKKFYRDHLAHVMKVALTALELLGRSEASPGPLARDGRPALDWVAQRLSAGALGSDGLRGAARRLGVSDRELAEVDFWRDAMVLALRLSGLLHDMAYPQLMALRLRHAAAAVNALSPYELPATASLERALDAIDGTYVAAPFGDLASEQARRVCQHVLAESHSLQAGVALLEARARADRLWRLTPFEAFALEWAAAAAAMHDYDKLFERRPRDAASTARKPSELEDWLRVAAHVEAVRPCFQRDPVAYLLALADQLQDFGRLNYDALPAHDVGVDHPRRHEDAVPLGLRYPWSAVTLEVDEQSPLPHAHLTFEVGPSESVPAAYAVPKPLAARLTTDKAKKFGPPIFGPNGWLDHKGLFADVQVRASQQPPSPQPAALKKTS